jgi:uncharacterized membrane protein
MEFEDTQLQRLISFTLRSGVLVAVIIGVLGGTLFLAVHRADPVSFRHFAGATSLYASPAKTAEEALHPQAHDTNIRGLAIAQVGIICLLLTPIIRVALSIFGFALERDGTYVAITAIVLATLTCSLLLH